MKTTYPEIPEWTFDVDEVSNGVYKIIALSDAGDTFSHVATELNLSQLIEQCKHEASKITSTRQKH